MYEDITLINGQKWRFYQKITADNYWSDMSLLKQLDIIYGNLLMVRNCDETLIYVPKSQ